MAVPVASVEPLASPAAAQPAAAARSTDGSTHGLCGHSDIGTTIAGSTDRGGKPGGRGASATATGRHRQTARRSRDAAVAGPPRRRRVRLGQSSRARSAAARAAATPCAATHRAQCAADRHATTVIRLPRAEDAAESTPPPKSSPLVRGSPSRPPWLCLVSSERASSERCACSHAHETSAPNRLGVAPNRFGLSPQRARGSKPECVGGVGGVGGSNPQAVGDHPSSVGGRRSHESHSGTCKSWYYRPPSSIFLNPTTVWATRAPETGVVQRWLPVLLI